MEILGRPLGTVLLTAVTLLIAFVLLFSGIWGLRRAELWMGGGDLMYPPDYDPAAETVRGPPARWLGALLIVLGLVALGAAWRLWF